MKLSIIIPTFNEENYLPNLLESIKKQKFSDYEVIVSDSGSKSSENTLRVAFFPNIGHAIPIIGLSFEILK